MIFDAMDSCKEAFVRAHIKCSIWALLYIREVPDHILAAATHSTDVHVILDQRI